MRWIKVLAAALGLSGCAIPTDATDPVTPEAGTSPASALAWEEGSPEHRRWSEILRSEIALQLSSFDRAADRVRFCPAYDSLSRRNRVEVISTLAVAISRYESEYDPDAVGKGRISARWIGLFQLSHRGYFARCARQSGKPLTDPETNIRCAVPAMADLVKQDRRLAGGDGQKAATGIGRWWSVLRPGRHLAEIVKRVRALPYCGG